MSTTKTLTALAASSVLALVAFSPAYAESIPKMEQDQVGNSTQPDVDPGASKGPDKSIVDQERMQLGNSPGPNVPEGAGAATQGGESIPDMEQQDLAD